MADLVINGFNVAQARRKNAALFKALRTSSRRIGFLHSGGPAPGSNVVIESLVN